MDVTWDGITQSRTFNEKIREIRTALADAAKSHDWPTVLNLLEINHEFVNSCHLDGWSLYTPLHQVAYAGASSEIAEKLINMGAFRTMQNRIGERPIDIAVKNGHKHLYEILEPEYKHHVPTGILIKIQLNFHEVIKGRIDLELPNHELRLPELEPLLELEKPEMWFPVPGMYGGFSYALESEGVNAKLISNSWSRVDEGSGQRHEITSRGSQLVEEGFV